MKYLVVGLGNIGTEYENTRHNIGFKILDSLAKQSSIFFSTDKLGDIATLKHKGRTFILLKPSTYMNLSGKAVNYWMQKEKISLLNLLVVTDDLALNFGTLRLRAKGNDGGHNGLKNINQTLNTTEYARLRFGVGSDFEKGRQVDYVLGSWSEEEKQTLQERIDLATQCILTFGTIGIAKAMSEFNSK
jgi:peptidyl-tRNA hydrolase, PTH1 family